MLNKLFGADKGDDVDGIGPLWRALPYRSFTGDDFVVGTDSVGFVIEFNPNDGLGDDAYDAFIQFVLQKLPDNAFMQVSLWATPYIKNDLSAWAASQNGAPDLLQAQAHARMTHFMDAASQPWPEHRECLHRYRGLIGIAMKMDDASSCDLTLLRDGLLRELTNQGVGAALMNHDDILHWMRCWLNMPSPDKSYLTDWHKNTPLNEQIVDPGVVWIEIDDTLEAEHNDWCVTPYVAASLPETWSGPFWSELCGHQLNAWQQMNSAFAYHLMFEKGVKRQDKTRADTKYKQAIKAVRNSLISKLNPSLVKARENWQYVNTQMAEGNEGLVSMSVSATVMSPKANHAQACSQLETQGLSHKVMWTKPTWRTLATYLSQCPLYGANGGFADLQALKRARTSTVTAAVHLMPLAGPASERPLGMLLTGRRGEIFGFDNFDATNSNYNVAVTGLSGSGKSVFIQEMIARHLSMPNRRVFTIDIGRSYEALCHVLGGQYISFSTKNRFSLNPFTHIGDDEWADAKPQIISLLYAMVGENEELAKDSTHTFVMKSLESCWNEMRSSLTITAIMRAWVKHPSPQLKEYGLRLVPYTLEGDYGHWFDGPCDLKLDNPFVVLELEELKEHKRLSAVILMLLMTQVTNVMYRAQRKQNILCVIDEAWDLFSDDKFGKFTEHGYRRARKYKGGFVSGTQSILDYGKSTATRAALNNAYTKVFLRQNENDVMQAVGCNLIPQLTQGERQQLMALRTVNGGYSECVIRNDGGHTRFGRLVLDNFSKTLYSSDAATFASIRDLVASGVSWIDAVTRLAHQTNQARDKRHV